MPKILVIKISSLGDILHALPILKPLKKMPDTSISWLVGRAYKDLLEGNPYLDKLFIFERERWRGMKNCVLRQGEIWHLVQEIRKENFDICIDLQGLFRSAFFTFFSGAKEKIGFAHARELAPFFYNHRVVVPSHLPHAADKNVALVKKIVGNDFSIEFPIALSDQDKQKAKMWLPKAPRVVLVPGTRWPSKCWPASYFAGLVDAVIQSKKATVALVGAPGDRFLGDKILGLSKAASQVVNLIGQTSLKELAAVMKEADLVVSNDSGPMHIAAAMGATVIALFGPTDTQKTAPYGEKHIVLQSGVDCSPCRNRICTKSPSCMEKLLPEDVFARIEKIL